MNLLLRSVGLAVLLMALCSPLWAEEGQGRVYYDFGVFAYEDGDYAGAELNLKKALSFEPGNPYYNHYLGKTYLKTERLDEAATYLESARRIDPALSGLGYDLATLYFKKEQYREAARLYDEIAPGDPNEVLAQYYAGICHLKIEDYDQALDRLLRAADRSPTIRETGYYYAGICYLKRSNPEKAAEKFIYVRDNAKAASLRDSAVKWLAAAERQQKAMKPYALYLQMGYMHDSNVLLEAVDQDLPTDERDGALLGYFSGRYDVVKTDVLTLGGGYSHYHLDYMEHGAFDFIGSIPQLYIRYRLAPVTFSLAYSPQYYWLAGDSYLMKHQVRPDVLWQITSSLRARLAYAYEVKNYFVTVDRSADAGTVDGDLYYSLPGNRIQLFAGCGQENNTADSPAQDYRRTQGRLGAVFSLPWALRLQAVGKYTVKDYSNPNPVLGNLTRKDTTVEALGSLSRSLFFDWLRIMAEYRYTKNDSNIVSNNIDIFDYVRHQVTVSLTASF